MTRVTFIPASVALAAALVASPASAQGIPKLHVSNRWKECSFQLDPALTQAAWHQFTREAGVRSRGASRP